MPFPKPELFVFLTGAAIIVRVDMLYDSLNCETLTPKRNFLTAANINEKYMKSREREK